VSGAVEAPINDVLEKRSFVTAVLPAAGSSASVNLMDLQLEVPQDNDYTRTWKDKDGNDVVGHYRDVIFSYPRVLVITLGVFLNNGKNTSPIVLPVMIHLSDVMKAKMKEERQYTLKAIVCHKGQTVYGGHYICYAQRLHKGKLQWLRMNDDVVDVVDEAYMKQIREGDHKGGFQPYMLFYEQENRGAQASTSQAAGNYNNNNNNNNNRDGAGEQH
jgi:hypothetical protein